MKKRYFITVDWCNKGQRGIFCSQKGETISKEQPHSQDELNKYLDLFYIILNPKSESFTEEEVKMYNNFRPLAEYKGMFGIALKENK